MLTLLMYWYAATWLSRKMGTTGFWKVAQSIYCSLVGVTRLNFFSILTRRCWGNEELFLRYRARKKSRVSSKRKHNSNVVVDPNSAHIYTGFTTVCLGWNHHFSLGQRLKHVNPLKMTQKVVSVTEMTFLYDAWYSVVFLRPKNEVKFLTQSALGKICMGK